MICWEGTNEALETQWRAEWREEDKALVNERNSVIAHIIREAAARIRLARIFSKIPGGSWR